MTSVTVPRERDRATLPILLLLAVLVGVGVFQRVRYLQHEMVARWHTALEGGAFTTQATVDEWFGERTVDAEALAARVAVSLAAVEPVKSDGVHHDAAAASFVHRTICPLLQKPFELRALDTVIARLLEGAPVEPVIT